MKNIEKKRKRTAARGEQKRGQKRGAARRLRAVRRRRDDGRSKEVQ